jgi:hypothetical protein
MSVAIPCLKHSLLAVAGSLALSACNANSREQSATAPQSRAVMLGGWRVELEATTLADVARHFGAGVPMHRAEHGMSVLCYALRDGGSLTLGSSEMGGPSHQITEVTISAKPADAGMHCPSITLALRDIATSEGVSLGMTSAELERRMGRPGTPKEANVVAYPDSAIIPASTSVDGVKRPVASMDGATEARLADGRIVELLVWQVTST